MFPSLINYILCKKKLTPGSSKHLDWQFVQFVEVTSDMKPI